MEVEARHRPGGDLIIPVQRVRCVSAASGRLGAFIGRLRHAPCVNSYLGDRRSGFPFATAVHLSRADGRRDPYAPNALSTHLAAWSGACRNGVVQAFLAIRVFLSEGRVEERLRRCLRAAALLGLTAGSVATMDLPARPVFIFPLTAIVLLLTLSDMVESRFLTAGAMVCAVVEVATASLHVEAGARVDDHDLAGGIMGAVAIILVARLCRRSGQLARASDAQNAMLDHGLDAIFMEGPDGIITFWSAGAERLYGWSHAEAIGQRSDRLLQTTFVKTDFAAGRGPATADLLDEDVTRVARGGELLLIRRRRRAVGRGANDRLCAVLDTGRDMAGEWQLSDELDRIRAELFHVARLSTLGELVASIAHEVNQPLAALRTNGEACLRWLARDPIDPAAARFSVERMINNGRRASDIIARLRVMCSPTQPVDTHIAVNQLVDETISILKGELSDHSVALDLELGTGIPLLIGDRVEFQQVLINLVVNAVQALDSIKHRPRQLIIRTSVAEDGGTVILEIRDNGPGLRGTAPERLFDSFYTTKKDGMGMGLSICRSILERRGGRITARDLDHGPGACFQVEIGCNQPVSIAA